MVGAGSHDFGGLTDAGAAYVFVRTDTDWILQAKLTASDAAAYDYFGTAVAISGDSIVVGSLYDDISGVDQGSAYVFTRSGTTWSEQWKLAASDAASGDRFGTSVAISGDTVVVGAYYAEVDGNAYEGAAYVYTRSGISWSQQGKLTATDGAASDGFGFSVAISGDTVVVGSWYDDVGTFDEGSAYVFTRSGTSWTGQQKLIASDGAAGDNFGASIAISGDTVVVGAWNDDIGTNNDQGSAYVYTRSGATWTEQAKLTASDGAADDIFGHRVSVSGDIAVVGAPYGNVGSNSNQGSAYVFTRSGTAWTEQTKLTSSAGAASDQFGVSVAVSGDSVLVGSNADDVGSNTNQGSATVFQTRTSISKKTATDLAEGDMLGQSVALSGDTAVVGASGDDIGANIDQGSAYVFVREEGRWKVKTKLTAADGAAGDNFGWSVSIDGSTIVVGAPNDDVSGIADAGSTYVFVGSGASWTQETALRSPGPALGDQLGWSVAISGDIAFVGVRNFSAGNGAIMRADRSGTTWTLKGFITLSGASSGWGSSMAGSGSTFVVGAPTYNSHGTAAIITVTGPNLGDIAYGFVTSSDIASGDEFGSSVAISGNTVVVGAPGHDVGGAANQGSAYVFTGSGSTWTQQAALTASDGDAGDIFGRSVAVSGGTAVIGASGDDSDASGDQGSAYIFTRSDTSWTFQRKVVAPDAGVGDYFGHAVAAFGETALIGAPYDRFGSSGTGEGSVYMFYWGPPGPTAAGSKLSGRVLEPSGRGLRNATVVLTDSSGNTQTAQTGTFGNFSFSDLPSGETYVLSVKSKRFVFTPEAVSLFSDLEGLVIRASGKAGRR